jgi:hypothetical protein
MSFAASSRQCLANSIIVGQTGMSGRSLLVEEDGQTGMSGLRQPKSSANRLAGFPCLTVDHLNPFRYLIYVYLWLYYPSVIDCLYGGLW